MIAALDAVGELKIKYESCERHSACHVRPLFERNASGNQSCRSAVSMAVFAPEVPEYSRIRIDDRSDQNNVFP